MKYDNLVTPIVKWAGGKRQLLPEIRKYIPEKIGTYYEPFVGGGAVLFDLQPERAIVNDINSELINLYQVVKDDVQGLIEDLSKHKNEADYYYNIRALDRDEEAFKMLSDIERASRIHFLNKTCFNGLFRVNLAGQFNTPFGKYKNPNIVNSENLKAVSEYFNVAEVEFRCTDFENALNGIKEGDFVYFDPPYDPISESSSFTGYAAGGFGRDEQKRLKLLCDKLDSIGVKFLLSNSSTKFILDLYKDYNVEIIQARRLVNSDVNGRGEVDEVLVRNYE